VVLSRNFLSPAEVSDARIKQVASVLIVVGGHIVHDSHMPG
jgi:hypothetical protein